MKLAFTATLKLQYITIEWTAFKQPQLTTVHLKYQAFTKVAYEFYSMHTKHNLGMFSSFPWLISVTIYSLQG